MYNGSEYIFLFVLVPDRSPGLCKRSLAPFRVQDAPLGIPFEQQH